MLQPTTYNLQPVPKFAFFGTPNFAVIILDELKTAGLIPSLIVTAPDKPQGRGLSLAPPPVKVWAEQNNIPVLQPVKLDSGFCRELSIVSYELFVVAAYGKIISKEILDLPKHGTLNVHPSLLPKFRGSSPIESAILAGEKETGISIMLLDEEMDHGPVVESRKLKTESNMEASELENLLAHEGGKLLVEVIPKWIEGKIEAKEQNHAEATYTKKITKEDGLIDLDDSPEKNYRKYLAYFGWPGTYFFAKRKNNDFTRVVIKKASLSNDNFLIERVLPEGKKEMDYADFKHGL